VWLIAIVVVIASALSIVFYSRGGDWKVLLTIVGGAISLIYVIEKQQLDEAILFKELFVEFNQRYDKLNEELNRIRTEDTKQPLKPTDLNCLFDYFNLCGEEYLFYRKGYIYPEVWKSWVMGMKIFFSSERICPIWTEELKSDSYYGLDVRKEIKVWCTTET